MKIALIGYGKMGKAIEQHALAKAHEIVLKVSQKNIAEFTADNLRRADVAIEFSRPETATANILFCLKNHVPVVSGTTGWLEHWDKVTSCCHEQNSAFLYASNFSIGVNVMYALNRYLAKLMDGRDQYDVSIEEIHHTQKLDYPSGTAISLAQDIIEHTERKKVWESSLANGPVQGNADQKADNSLHIFSQRTANVPGTHHVKWSSPIDEITISHVAHSREGFASGALAAAEWLLGKKGVYGMRDVLGL